MDHISAVRRTVDRLLEGELGPLLDLLAEDVEFEVAGAGEMGGCPQEWGKRPVAEYFAALGGLVAFWQVDYSASGDQVIAWGKESFTVEGCRIEGGGEFALVFDLSEGRITRFVVIEELEQSVIIKKCRTTPAAYSPYISVMSRRSARASSGESTPSFAPSRPLLTCVQAAGSPEPFLPTA